MEDSSERYRWKQTTIACLGSKDETWCTVGGARREALLDDGRFTSLEVDCSTNSGGPVGPP